MVKQGKEDVREGHQGDDRRPAGHVARRTPKPVTPMAKPSPGATGGGRRRRRDAGPAAPERDRSLRRAGARSTTTMARGGRHRGAAREVQRAGVHRRARRQEGGRGARGDGAGEYRAEETGVLAKAARERRGAPPPSSWPAMHGGAPEGARPRSSRSKDATKSAGRGQAGRGRDRDRGDLRPTKTEVTRSSTASTEGRRRVHEGEEQAARAAVRGRTSTRRWSLQGRPLQRLDGELTLGQGQVLRDAGRGQRVLRAGPRRLPTSEMDGVIGRRRRPRRRRADRGEGRASPRAAPRSQKYVAEPAGATCRRSARRPQDEARAAVRRSSTPTSTTSRTTLVDDARRRSTSRRATPSTTRIEEMQAANKGLVDKAIDAVGGVDRDDPEAQGHAARRPGPGGRTRSARSSRTRSASWGTSSARSRPAHQLRREHRRRT